MNLCHRKWRQNRTAKSPELTIQFHYVLKDILRHALDADEINPAMCEGEREVLEDKKHAFSFTDNYPAREAEILQMQNVLIEAPCLLQHNASQFW